MSNEMVAMIANIGDGKKIYLFSSEEEADKELHKWYATMPSAVLYERWHVGLVEFVR